MALRATHELNVQRSFSAEAVQDAPWQLVVDADPDQVVVDGKALAAREDRIGCRIEVGLVLQAYIKVLDLRGELPGEAHLHASSCGPAPMRVRLANDTGRTDLVHVYRCPHGARCRIQEPVAVIISDAAAEGGKP